MKPLQPDLVEIVSLDAGGTLLFPHPSVGEVYAEVLRRHGVNLPPEEIERRFRERFAVLRDGPREKVDDAAEKAFWQALVRSVLSPECPAELFPRVFEELYDTFARGDRWRVAEGGRELLEWLRSRGLRVVLLSNADSRLRNVLEEKGLSEAFDGIFISAEVGYEKPDLRLFRVVEDRMGAAGAAFLHVGDSAYHDVQGAVAAGWQAVQLGGDDAPRDGRISRLDDLRSLLG
ncbi:MAG: hypothetical protein Kow00109_28500 [Acidobacteriota bacterium]